MKLRNILMVVATMGIMFSSMDRTGVVGYTEGDYTDMNTFAHKAAGQNVAWTAGSNFAAVWSDGGTTWGFRGGDTDDMVNMMWSNGTYGLDVAMSQDSNPNGDGSGLVRFSATANDAVNFSFRFGTGDSEESSSGVVVRKRLNSPSLLIH